MEPYKLPPEAKDRWLAALRSGRYRQGRGCLHEVDRFCCLGVLTDLYVDNWDWYEEYDGNEDVLPDLEAYTGPEIPAHICYELVRRNDGAGRERHTFEQIADYIEENL